MDEEKEQINIGDNILIVEGKYKGMQGTLHDIDLGMYFVLATEEGCSERGFKYTPGLYAFIHNELQKNALKVAQEEKNYDHP